MSIFDMAYISVERTFYWEDEYYLQMVKDILSKWHEKGYLAALGLIARRPRFFEIVRDSVEKHGNVSEMHQSHDGIFTISYSDEHEDYLTADGKRYEIRRRRKVA